MYFADPEERRRQQEQAARTGMYTRSGAISTPIPPTPGTQPQRQSPKSDWKKPLLNTAIKEGLTEGAGLLGGEIAGGAPTVTGTDAAGNTTFSDGAVVKPDGSVVTEGSYANAVKQWGGNAAALYNFYKAMQSKDTKGKVLGGAGAVNAGLMANNVYGAGPGALIGSGIGAAGVLSSDMTADQQGKALRKVAEDGALNFVTGGIWGGVQALDKAVLGGTVNKLRNKMDEIPVLNIPGKITDKVLGEAVGTWSSKKGADQMRRDQVRKMLQEGGFFGADKNKDDWTIENPDGSSFDIGKDGGARLNGRRYYELDMGSQNPVQAKAIGAVQPLSYLITGGDKKLATAFGGYLTNTIMQGKGGEDVATANLNALDKYKKAGFDTVDKALSGIEELIKAGKIPPEEAEAFRNGVRSVFGTSPKPTANPQQSGQGGPQTKPNSKKRRSGAGRRGSYTEQTYTPNVYAPTTTAPLGSSSPYSDGFAQSLANVYASNQGL